MRLLFTLLVAFVAAVWAGPPDALVVNTLGKNDSYIPVEDPCIKSPCVLIDEPVVELKYRNYTSFGIEEVYQSDTFTVSFQSLNHTVPLFFMFFDKKGFEKFEAGDDSLPYYTGSIIPTPYPNAAPEDLIVEERTFKLTRYFDSLFVVFSNESPLSTEVPHCDYQISLSYQGLGCVTYFFVVLAIPVCLVAIMLMICIGPCYRRCCNRCDPHGVRAQHAAYYEARRQRVRARERARLDETTRRRAAGAVYQACITQGKSVAEATVAAEAAGAAAVARARAGRPTGGASIPPSPLSRSSSGVPMTPTSLGDANAAAAAAGSAGGAKAGYQGGKLPPSFGAPLLSHDSSVVDPSAVAHDQNVSADHVAGSVGYSDHMGSSYGFGGSSFGFSGGYNGGYSGGRSGPTSGLLSPHAGEVDWEAEAAGRAPEDEVIGHAAREARLAGAGAAAQSPPDGYVSPSVAPYLDGNNPENGGVYGSVSPAFAGASAHAHSHHPHGSSRRYASATTSDAGVNQEQDDTAAAAKANAPAYFQYDFSEDENAVYVQPATCWYCCVYRPYQFTHPLTVKRTWCPAAGRCRLPYPRCCPSLYYFTGRPLTDYWHWWRQRALITWPWNPLADEDIIKFRHRLMLVITVLSFNLLVLTKWAALFGMYNKTVTSRFVNVPVVGRYLVLYIGASIIQDVFTALMRPLLAFTLHIAPKLKRSPNPIIRGVGFVAYYLGVGLALTLVTLVAINTVDLAQRYRCWVLQTQVLLPFLIIHIARMFFVFAVVPLPIFYHLQCAYGALIPPGIDVRTGDLYPDKARRLAAAHPYGRDDDDFRSVAWADELDRVGGDPAMLSEFATEDVAIAAREAAERDERRRRSSVAAAAEVAASSSSSSSAAVVGTDLSDLGLSVEVPSGASPGSAGSLQQSPAVDELAHGQAAHGHGLDVGEAAAGMFPVFDGGDDAINEVANENDDDASSPLAPGGDAVSSSAQQQQGKKNKKKGGRK